MVEPLLSGIVLGLMPVTIAGLLETAFLQYRRGRQLNLLFFFPKGVIFGEFCFRIIYSNP